MTTGFVTPLSARKTIRILARLLILLGFCFMPVLRISAQSNAKPAPQLLYYIPHTHWEGAVFKTREEYLEMGLVNILKAVQLLKQYPEYKFALDQVAYFKPFLERYPEEAAAFRKFVREGRLEIVGGMDVMPDDVKPGGELFIRQMQYGKTYCREQLGLEVKVAWLLDTFGHHAQMPQLLRLAGFDSFWFCRGVPHNHLPSEFRWRGIDGTEIPAFWLPGFYGLFYGPQRQFPDFAKFFEDRFRSLDSHAVGFERVGPAGVDVSEPEDYVPPLVVRFNQQPNAPFQIRYSVPSEFAAVVARRSHAPVITNDFNPIFQGTYSSRIELKQTTRRLEQLLLTAETLTALASWLGAPPDRSMLWRAWEPVLFNQTHDLASGVMTDHVYEDTIRSYDFSERLAEQIISDRWNELARCIDTRGDGVPVLIFNPLGFSRTDIAETQVGFAEKGVRSLRLLDASGNDVPFEILQKKRGDDGGIEQATLLFVARDIPALGYSTYHAIGLPKPTEQPTESFSPNRDQSNSIENEFFRVTCNPQTGEINSLWDKELQWEALAGPANVVARQQDKGDLWELYHGLDGGSYIAMTNRQPVPRAGDSLLSNAQSGSNGVIHRGPVMSEFTVSHPFGNGSFATRVRLYAGVKRVDIRTELMNNEKYVRYQALFPITIGSGHYVQEIPFGALERPEGVEFPAQHWVDYGDAAHGVTLLNFGLPGNLMSENTLMLSLLRSHNLGAYGFGGGYEPGMSSETGFEIGQKRAFQYALVPHQGGWQQSAPYRSALEFSHPFLVRKAEPHPGSLPGRWGMLELSAPNVILTAFKPGLGKATVLRLYEASGRTTQVQLKLHTKINSANEANLLEDQGAKIRVHQDTLYLAFHPFEIKTIQLQLSSSKMSRDGSASFR